MRSDSGGVTHTILSRTRAGLRLAASCARTDTLKCFRRPGLGLCWFVRLELPLLESAPPVAGIPPNGV